MLCEAAETALGKEKKKYPDWFKENLPRLKPLFTERNRLYLKWRTTGRESDRQKFAKIRSQTRRLVREMKNAWFLAKAMEAQRGRNGGKLVWKCIRDLQHGRVGKVPIRSATIRNEDGSMCTTPEEIQQRWRRHFTSILNTQSSFNEEELREVRQRPPRPSMAEPPTEEEVVKAIGAMKNGKAGGHSGILPEMIKAASSDDLFRNTLVTLVRQVWREETTPTDWRDALLVPIQKKGDLSRCDNWRGISLLDVVGKVAARVLQGRRQLLAEDLLPESQCGFRKERSCTDMIFLIRQLLEKSWGHRAKVFVTFVDLRKAYDSIPRRALWIALGKLGLPESIIHLIRSFHQDMSAQIRLVLDPLTVTNGLRQGCCMASVLFNLYLTVVIERWQGKVKDHPDIGISLKHKYDGKLFRRYTRNASSTRILECLFADDGALLATSREGAEKAAQEFQNVCKNFGLTVNISKTKHFSVGREATASDNAALPVTDGCVEGVEHFPYLGSIISASGRLDKEVEERIAKASRESIFLDKNLYRVTKAKIYQACVLSTLLYGSECWVPLKKHLRKLDSFHHRCVRMILGISNHQQWIQRISTRQVLSQWGDTEPVSVKITRRRLEWLGHLARMPEHRLPKSALFGWLPQPCPRCGPHRRWRDVIRSDLKLLGVAEHEWYDKASSRAGWRSICRSRMLTGEPTATAPGPPPLLPHPHSQEWYAKCAFSRESDKKRHKCLEERQKPVSEQRGAVKCMVCRRWLHSRGGLAVHRCRPAT